jgi:uncharacterized membrane protein
LIPAPDGFAVDMTDFPAAAEVQGVPAAGRNDCPAAPGADTALIPAPDGFVVDTTDFPAAAEVQGVPAAGRNDCQAAPGAGPDSWGATLAGPPASVVSAAGNSDECPGDPLVPDGYLVGRLVSGDFAAGNSDEHPDG